MVLSPEDKILIKALHEVKGYGARRIVSEFPAKQQTVSSVTRLIRKLRETGTVDRRNGSGRPRRSMARNGSGQQINGAIAYGRAYVQVVGILSTFFEKALDVT